MRAQTIQIRARFFLAVEGQSEQSFVRWLQILSEKDLHIHLDAFPLGGGGFKSMLRKAVCFHERHSRTGAYRDRFLVIDQDRATQGDWSIAELRREAAKHRITVCVQCPNHEGLLLRMMPGMEREVPDAASAKRELKKHWEDYQKPVNARALSLKFSLADLLRFASVDPDFGTLLRKIGLKV